MNEPIAAPGAYPVLDRRRAFLIPFTAACGNFMGGLDGFIVTTSLPQIALSLHETPLRLSIAITSYLLSLAIFTPLSGWAADRFGVRRVYCAAILTFTGASVLCGLSTDLWMLVAARALQGFGGALMNPVGQLVVLRTFPKERMLKVNNYMIMMGLLGPLCGPLIGGFITTYFSWPWIFYINVPIGLLNCLSAWRLFGDFPAQAPRQFDVPGFVLAGVAIALIQITVGSLGSSAGVRPLTIVLALLMAGFIAAYVFHALRVEHPLLDLRLFRVRTFRLSTLSGGLSSMGMGAYVFLMPLLFQVGFGLSPMQSGARTFIMALSSILARAVATPILRAFGFRRVLVWNTCVAAVLVAGAALLRADTPLWLALAYLFAFGLPRAIQMSGIQNLAYSDVPPDRMSRFAPLTSVCNQMWQSFAVGGAAGILSLLTTSSGRTTPADFRITFVIAGLVTLGSLAGFLRLTRADGAHVTGHGARTAKA